MAPLIDMSANKPGSGVIWVNSSHEGSRYVREAERSAKTVRRFVEEADLVLVSDKFHEDLDPIFDFQAPAHFYVPDSLRDKVHFNGQMVAKLSVLKQMTWEKNIYLGSDIVALRPGIQDIFRLLDRFDLVVSHAPLRINTNSGGDEKLSALPECFPEMNGDLVAYRRSKSMGDLLTEWERIYSTNAINHAHDQGALRYLVFNSDLKLYIVPPEYNHRGYDFSAQAVILQRREAIPLYAKHYSHVAEIYGC
jgi:hypothetical protein